MSSRRREPADPRKSAGRARNATQCGIESSGSEGIGPLPGYHTDTETRRVQPSPRLSPTAIATHQLLAIRVQFTLRRPLMCRGVMNFFSTIPRSLGLAEMAAFGAPAGASVCAGSAVQPRLRWPAPCPAWIPCRGCCQHARARAAGGTVPPQLSMARRLLGGGVGGRGPPAGGCGRSAARAGAEPARYGSGAAGASRSPVRAQLSVPRPRNQGAVGASAGSGPVESCSHWSAPP